jgi:hypothetical protein
MNQKKEHERIANFLLWLITPETEEEKKLFKERDCVDDYIEIANRLPKMSEKEIIKEINIQLQPFNLEYDELN